MKRAILAVLLCPLLVSSAIAQGEGGTLDGQLQSAQREQAAAAAAATRLEQAAAQAQSQAAKLHAEQAAAAQSIAAAEARITAADIRLQIAVASIAASREKLAAEQRPASSLLAGLATMAQRPPLLALADEGGTDELVKVRLLLDATLPVIRRRTAGLSSQLAEGEQARRAALAARQELTQSRGELVERRSQYATLERRSIELAFAKGGQALTAGDTALAAGETVERLRGEAANGQSIRAVAAQLASADPAPSSPFAPDDRPPVPPFAYQLPAVGAVSEGLAAVSPGGVRSRGLTLAVARGAAVIAPATGTVRYSGPFRDYDGVVIIDHGGGWLSLIVNVGSSLKPGDRVRMGDTIGRALGPLQVELSQNGRRMSPAIIAGSSQTLSNGAKGG